MHAPPAILIVDDTAENRRLYTAMLAGMPIEIVAVDSAAAALEAAAQREFAMILLDVSMPEMCGFEAAHRLRELPLAARTPIVFASAVYTRDVDAYTGYSEGAVDYIVAPVASHILRSKVAVFVDLYLKNLEARRRTCELAAAHRALQAAYAELETFSYCAAHDLRSPLMQIAAFTRFLDEDYAERLDEEGRDQLRKIAAATARMNALIDDLLELAKLAHTDLQRAAVDLSDLAGEIAAGFTASEPARPVDWRIAPALVADGDPALLRALLHNLLGNAWKYTGKTPRALIEFGAETTTETTTETAAGCTTYYVRDNGAGFDMARAGKLFKPFERLHGQGDFPGTGVGLAICQRIVAKHGGSIRATAERGRGATFYFTLGAAAAAPTTAGEPT